MGTGIGKTQQRILNTLAEEQEALALTVADLAQRIGCFRQADSASHQGAGNPWPAPLESMAKPCSPFLSAQFDTPDRQPGHVWL